MCNKLKLGMIGAGFVANFHARALKQVRNVDLAGVMSVSPELSEKLSRASQSYGTGTCKVYNTIADLAENVDAIAIFAPNFARVEIMEAIVDAVKKGANLKGIICEKPLGRNMKEARRLVELAREVNLKTAYFENQIFMKPMQAQLSQLQPQVKTMGPLVLTRSAEEHGGPHEGWFWDPTRQGGGVLSDMGCHSIAVGWYALTPVDKSPRFLEPVSISAETALLKWGLPEWRKKLKENMGVDYTKTPAEDFTTGIVTFKNPETGQIVKAQFTDSWMFEKQGLRLFMDGMGPGYAFEINTLVSSLQIFIGDIAAEATANAELALEKSTASRGLLAVQHNEADLYGYTDENEDAANAFLAGKDGLLDWEYGLEITKMIMAGYMSAERGKVIDLTDPKILQELETFIPLIQQGKGTEVLHVVK
ncbi:MAG: Gfo/Idh/MocA family oxidoreductase [Calditrichaeota bacterium]|nr:Gfo/Idh/MocA family oxidoreductase [Calditrichota bacterium]